jgi:hypothetical protein
VIIDTLSKCHSVLIPYFLTSFFPMLRNFPSGGRGEFLLVMGVGLLAVIARLERRKPLEAVEKRLLVEFRSIAQEPLPEPSDPRFKSWVLEERFGCTAFDRKVVLHPRTERWIGTAARWVARWIVRPILLLRNKAR